MHIVLEKCDTIVKEFHIASFKAEHEDQAREYAAYLQECEAARESGDTPGGHAADPEELLKLRDDLSTSNLTVLEVLTLPVISSGAPC